MKVTFNFCKLNNCGIKITDNSEYLSGEDFVFQEFKSEDIYCINVLEEHKIEEDSIYTTKITKAFESSEFEKLIDGWYTLHHIILPSEEYFNKIKLEEGIFNQYNGFYYTDGEKYYKYLDSETTEVDIIEIVTRNPLNTSILSYCANYFSLCQLNECYINYARKILSGNIRCENYQSKELIFNRDLIWMTLNVIKYYVELEKLENALVLLNKLDSCNGVCKHNLKEYDTKRCNCN